jgi:hypothetical protein
VLHEITWLETQYHENMEVSETWLQWLTVWCLSPAAKRNRALLLSAEPNRETSQREEAESDLVSVFIGIDVPSHEGASSSQEASAPVADSPAHMEEAQDVGTNPSARAEDPGDADQSVCPQANGDQARAS